MHKSVLFLHTMLIDIAMIKVNIPNVQKQSAIGSLFLSTTTAGCRDNLANHQLSRRPCSPDVSQKLDRQLDHQFGWLRGEWRLNTL